MIAPPPIAIKAARLLRLRPDVASDIEGLIDAFLVGRTSASNRED